MLPKNESHWAAIHFTLAEALGHCESDAETRFLDEFPGMSPDEKTVAILGCKQAINAALETSDEWSAVFRQKVESALKKRKLPNLKTLHAELEKKKARILQRGRILDEEEFYLASDVLANPRAGLTSTKKEKWERLLAIFESTPRL